MIGLCCFSNWVPARPIQGPCHASFGRPLAALEPLQSNLHYFDNANWRGFSYLLFWPCNKKHPRGFHVVQSSRVRLSMQERPSWIANLGRSHMPQSNEALCHNCWAHMLQLLKPSHSEPVLRNKRNRRNEKVTHCNEEQPRSPGLEKSPRSNEDPTQPKRNKELI